MKNIRGANAILTGASRGLGTYIAATLAEKGVNLVLAARTADKLEATRAAAEAKGVRAIAVPCDVTSRDDLQRLVATAERELGSVDILINNAGIEIVAGFPEHSFGQIDSVLRTNLSGPIWLTKMVLPSMVARRRGAIVNVASMAGKSGVAYSSIYSTSKFGLIGFTKSLRAELDGTGVTAGVVCPTFVSESGMWANYGGKAPMLAREVSPQKVAAAVLRAIAGQPEILVNAGPIRPLLAAGELFPSFLGAFMKRAGIISLMRDQAKQRALGEDRAGATAATSEREKAEASRV